MSIHKPFYPLPLGVLAMITYTYLAAIDPHSVFASQKITLDQAYVLALKNNPTISLLKERVVQAEATKYRAWAAFKPTLGFQGSFTHSDEEVVVDFAKELAQLLPAGTPSTNMTTSPTIIQKSNQFAFNVTANLPLFNGPAYSRLKIAREGLAVAQLKEIRSRQDFLLRVAQAYYVIVTQMDAVKALEHKLSVDQKHLLSAKAQHEVGQAARATILRADLIVTQDQQNLRTQKNSLGAAQRQLAILIGHSDSLEVERPPDPPNPSDSDQHLLTNALQQRTDFRASELSLKIAQLTKKAIWWGFAPTLDLSWNYRWTEASGFANKNGTWNILLNLNAPLYDGGIRYAELRDSQSKITEAAEQKRSLLQDIESEVVKLQADLDSAHAGVISAHKAVGLAKQTVEDMAASYEVGAATQLDVLDASQRLLDAELQLTSSLYNRDLIRLSLAHALGMFNPVRPANAHR